MSEAAGGPALRMDKWLWFARFYKSRALAARMCETRRIRVNGVVVGKAHHLLRAGDTLTFVWNERVRVIQVAALGSRRGPAPEARALYVELNADDAASLGDPVPGGGCAPAGRGG